MPDAGPGERPATRNEPEASQVRVYPEIRFGGHTRVDGTVAFAGRVQALLDEVGPGPVLDVGCGRGNRVDDPVPYRRALQDLRGPGRRVIGIDLDPRASTNPYLDEFRQLTPGARWPIEDASIALVYCDYVLEHVDDPAPFFAEVARVLRPGGVACLRTANRRGYIALASRLVPGRLHARVIARANRLGIRREEQDVFATRYRCNTRGQLRAALQARGLEAAVWTTEAQPSYFDSWPVGYRIAAFLHEWTPRPFRNSLVAFARKPRAAGS